MGVHVSTLGNTVVEPRGTLTPLTCRFLLSKFCRGLDGFDGRCMR